MNKLYFLARTKGVFLLALALIIVAIDKFIELLVTLQEISIEILNKIRGKK